MPTVNVRPPGLPGILNGDFIRRNDHLAIYALLPGVLRSLHGRRVGLVFSDRYRNSTGTPLFYDEVNGLTFTYTNTAGAVATLASPGIVRFQHGYGGNTRLGSGNARALFTADNGNLDITTGEGENYAPTRGLSIIAGIVVPPNFTNPAAGAAYSIGGKWQNTGNQRSYHFDYFENGGSPNWRFALSTDGTAANIQVWTGANTAMRIATGSANWQMIVVGCSLAAGEGVYFYKNTDWTYVDPPTTDGPGLGGAGTIFNSTANYCIARRDDTTINHPWWDGYWVFYAMTDSLILPDHFRSFYEFVKPVMLYNTNLEGN